MTLQEEIKELNKIHDELEPTFEYTLSELEELKQQVRAEVIEELAEFVLYDFAPLFTKQELIQRFNEQLKEQNK